MLLTACGGGGGGGGSNPPPSGGGNPPPPPPANQAPTANAGADQTVEMPFAAALSGGATDPDTAAGSLIFQWTGPSGVAFESESSAVTEATFPAAGSYELTLTVNDGTTSDTDTVLVTVNAAVFPAADTSDVVPDRGWTRITPADAGMTQSLLDQASAVAQASPAPPAGAGPGNGMIVRRGRLVYSWGDIDQVRDVKSVTKSMGGIALGIALDEDRIALTDLAREHEPLIITKTPPGNDPRTEQITTLQLATHTAGFEKPGGYRPLIFDPGTTWFYSDGGLNWLADALTNVFASDLVTLTGTRVWEPLGLDYGIEDDGDDVRWRNSIFRPDDRGTGLTYRELAAGIHANVNAMARFGLLFLRRGVWNDQRIVSEEFVDLVQTPRPEVASAQNPEAARFPGATTDYGLLWWTNKSGQLANVPTDAYWAWGLGEALIVIIPSLDLVIARNGGQMATDPEPGQRTWNDFNWDGQVSVLAPFLDPIVQSVN